MRGEEDAQVGGSMIEAAPLIGSVRAMAATPPGRAGPEASKLASISEF
jgi:hypothetical protein